jgi:phosphoribosylformimino-5-aminoimidazole carboxamide ribotide isomerase
MIIYPAIDLHGGQVVRLREGDPERQTIFSHHPVEMAQRWIDEGAEWLHIVNLDGAFAKANDNADILKEISSLGVPVQFGGGLRSMDDMTQALKQGASRIVLGTVAIENPALVREALAQFGADKICVALDARDGFVTTHGWTNASDQTPVSLGRSMAEAGVLHALYTDVNRDGGLIGSNVNGTISLARNTGLQVIASGGVTKMTEIAQLAHSGVVAGAVIGMALYTGELTLKEALIASKEPQA